MEEIVETAAWDVGSVPFVTPESSGKDSYEDLPMIVPQTLWGTGRVGSMVGKGVWNMEREWG